MAPSHTTEMTPKGKMNKKQRAKFIRAKVGPVWWDFTPGLAGGKRRRATSIGAATLLKYHPKISLQEVEEMLDDIGIIPPKAHLRRIYNGHRQKKLADRAGRLAR